jgi:hypothetical protein
LRIKLLVEREDCRLRRRINVICLFFVLLGIGEACCRGGYLVGFSFLLKIWERYGNLEMATVHLQRNYAVWLYRHDFWSLGNVYHSPVSNLLTLLYHNRVIY